MLAMLGDKRDPLVGIKDLEQVILQPDELGRRIKNALRLGVSRPHPVQRRLTRDIFQAQVRIFRQGDVRNLGLRLELHSFLCRQRLDPTSDQGEQAPRDEQPRRPLPGE